MHTWSCEFLNGANLLRVEEIYSTLCCEQVNILLCTSATPRFTAHNNDQTTVHWLVRAVRHSHRRIR